MPVQVLELELVVEVMLLYSVSVYPFLQLVQLFVLVQGLVLALARPQVSVLAAF